MYIDSLISGRSKPRLPLRRVINGCGILALVTPTAVAHQGVATKPLLRPAATPAPAAPIPPATPTAPVVPTTPTAVTPAAPAPIAPATAAPQPRQDPEDLTI